jgi:hypothetical protein
MNNRFERLSGVRIRKHDRAQFLSIQPAAQIADLRPEALNDLCQAGRPRGDRIAANVSASIVGTPSASKRERT